MLKAVASGRLIWKILGTAVLIYAAWAIIDRTIRAAMIATLNWQHLYSQDSLPSLILSNHLDFTIPAMLAFVFFVVAKRCLDRQLLRTVHILTIIAAVGGTISMFFWMPRILDLSAV